MEDETLNQSAESAEETTDAFLEGWDADTEESPETTEEEPAEMAPEAPDASAAQESATAQNGGSAAQNNPTEEHAAEEPQQPTGEKPELPHKKWTLRHLDEEKTVDEQEMTALAQKGLDYERVREKYDAAKPVMEMFTQLAKQAGMPVDQYISFVRTEAKKSSGMDEDAAKRSVALEDRESAISAKEAAEAERIAAENQTAKQENSTEERRNADIAEFQKTFPDVAKDVNTIPAEVWAAVQQGQRLTVAYALWREQQAISAVEKVKQESKTKNQNAQNAQRSTGSMKTAGAESKAQDPFMIGFDS